MNGDGGEDEGIVVRCNTLSVDAGVHLTTLCGALWVGKRHDALRIWNRLARHFVLDEECETFLDGTQAKGGAVVGGHKVLTGDLGASGICIAVASPEEVYDGAIAHLRHHGDARSISVCGVCMFLTQFHIAEV